MFSTVFVILASVFSFPIPRASIVTTIPVHNINKNYTPIKTNSILFIKENDDADDDAEDDPVEKFADFMGFEKGEKWKAVRYTVYALAGGYCVAEFVEKLGVDLSDPFRWLT